MVVRAGQGSHGTANQSSALLIKNSLRFDGSSYLTRSSGSSGAQTFTLSFWAKKTGVANYNYPVFGGGSSTSNYGYINYNNGQYLTFGHRTGGSGDWNSIPNASYRDTGAWYHHVVVLDFSNATQGDRYRLYTNGVEVDSFSAQTLPSNTTTTTQFFRSGENIRIGCNSYNTSNFFDGYFAEFHCVYGSALDPDQFGFTDPLTNTWRPKKYEGTYGTEGFYLDFSDPSNIGADRSGNGNNFTPTGFTADDVVPDSPSGIVFSTDSTSGITTVSQRKPTNWCTLNPLDVSNGGFGLRPNALSDGNLSDASTSNALTKGTIAVDSGKWYFEFTGGTTSSFKVGVALVPPTSSPFSNTDLKLLSYNGQYQSNAPTGSNGGTTYGGSISSTDIVGVAVDVDNRTIAWSVNGQYGDGSGNWNATYANASKISLESTGAVTPCRLYGQTTVVTTTFNFGQKDFSYTPPSGFLPLCTANLPRPSKAAVRPDKYFQTILYTGNNSTQTITGGLNFSPDFIWAKNRDTAGYHHDLYDRVRGDNLRVYSSQANAEGTGYLQFSDTSDFTLTSGGGINASGDAHVAWCWKAGGAAVSNTDGSITTQVSASPESGFSIIGYTGNLTTGASIGHGLNQAPEMLIFKSLSETRNWLIWHKDLNDGRGDYTLQFNALKRALDSRTDRPLKDTGCTTDTTIILGLDSEVNHNAGMLCYAFHSVSGFSKIGKYDGNGNADGPYIHCGFRPAFLLLKNYAGGSETDWIIQDSTRNTYNPVDGIFRANTNQAEATGNTNYYVDFLSNGFKLRTSSAAWNESGSLYIFMAIAEAPTNNLYGGQANAR